MLFGLVVEKKKRVRLWEGWWAWMKKMRNRMAVIEKADCETRWVHETETTPQRMGLWRVG